MARGLARLRAGGGFSIVSRLVLITLQLNPLHYQQIRLRHDQTHAFSICCGLGIG